VPFVQQITGESQTKSQTLKGVAIIKKYQLTEEKSNTEEKKDMDEKETESNQEDEKDENRT